MSGAVDLTNCDREPIHVPGSIQPHGALLALDEGLLVRQASTNLGELTGVDGAAALGQHARSVLGADAAEALEAALRSDRVERLNPLRLTIGGKDLLTVAHRQQGRVIVELEPRDANDDLRVSQLGATLGAISSSSSLPKLLQATVDEIFQLTAFDRVLAYRFDETGAGQVVAERCAPDMESYLDLHYPASDIPSQARRLYLLNWLRYIPDARYRPAPLLAAAPDEAPLDLTHSFLRSVSPIHVEYLANLGHQASMSISLVVHGRLWGLISCGHRQPHFLPYGLRAACELIGRLVSLQVAAHEEFEQRAEREAQEKLTALIVAGGDGAGEVLAGLATRERELLQLADATGLAVLTGEGWKTAGAVPPEPGLEAAASWLGAHASGLAYTHQASLDIPALAPFAPIASGVLAIGLPKPVANAILWFRPEVVRTVRWGGNPDKAVPEDQGRLRPRKSFEEWKQLVRGRARPWRQAVLDAAQDLRRHAIDLDLGLQVQLERKAVRARNDLMAVVSHDLRNPLNVAQISAAQLRRLLPGSDQDDQSAERAMLARIEAAVRHMNALVSDLLDLARIENGRFSVAPAPMPLSQLIKECVAFYQPLADRKHIELQVNDRHSGATVLADRERIFQVLTNLFGNALKFTEEGGQVSLEVQERADAFDIQVSDDGPGIAAEHLPRVFEKYFRGSIRRDGTGLGLFIAKGIVEAHGGKIWVRSTEGAGTTVGFSLPRA